MANLTLTQLDAAYAAIIDNAECKHFALQWLAVHKNENREVTSYIDDEHEARLRKAIQRAVADKFAIFEILPSVYTDVLNPSPLCAVEIWLGTAGSAPTARDSQLLVMFGQWASSTPLTETECRAIEANSEVLSAVYDYAENVGDYGLQNTDSDDKAIVAAVNAVLGRTERFETAVSAADGAGIEFTATVFLVFGTQAIRISV